MHPWNGQLTCVGPGDNLRATRVDMAEIRVVTKMHNTTTTTTTTISVWFWLYDLEVEKHLCGYTYRCSQTHRHMRTHGRTTRRSEVVACLHKRNGTQQPDVWISLPLRCVDCQKVIDENQWNRAKASSEWDTVSYVSTEELNKVAKSANQQRQVWALTHKQHNYLPRDLVFSSPCKPQVLLPVV